MRYDKLSRFEADERALILLTACYLEAEEWDLDDALISWRADSYLRWED